jgi:hypothetical protein
VTFEPFTSNLIAICRPPTTTVNFAPPGDKRDCRPGAEPRLSIQHIVFNPLLEAELMPLVWATVW